MATFDPINGPIILFDGVCNLCNGWVRFVIRRDPNAKFRFAALQSESGLVISRKLGIPAGQLQSIVLVKGDKFTLKSNAVLEIARSLSGIWPTFYFLKMLPRFFRDWIYDRIASNRYSIFGQRMECMIPTKELNSRFILPATEI